MYDERINKELQMVKLECMSPPLTNDYMKAVEYMRGRIQYFRDNGVPKQEIYELEMLLCVNIPEFVCKHFDEYFEIAQHDVTALFLAGEHFFSKGNFDLAHEMLTPLINYLSHNSRQLLDGKYCLQNVFEQFSFYQLNKGIKIEMTKDNYTAIYVLYAKILQNIPDPNSGQPPLFRYRESISYLDTARRLSPTNASVYLYMAKYFNSINDEESFQKNIGLAFEYVYTSNGVYGISMIYQILAFHYLNKDKGIFEALITIISHYDMQAALPMHYLMEKVHNCKSIMKIEEACQVLKENRIQVGFSDFVVETAELLSMDSRTGGIDTVNEVLRDKSLVRAWLSKSDETKGVEQAGLKQRRTRRQCEYCGGKMSGVLSRKCKSCGKKSDGGSLAAHILSAYERTDLKMRPSVFPSDYAFTERLIRDLVATLYGETYDDAADAVGQCVLFYVQYWTRRAGSFDNSHLFVDEVAQRMVNRFSMFPEEKVIYAVSICQDYVYKFIPEIKRRDDMIINPFNGYTAPIASENDTIKDLHIDDLEYGLVPEKPVFVAGFVEDKKYLSRLMNKNGSAVVCVRLGSMEVHGIAGRVDIYETKSETGQPLNRIYISNYGTKTSERAPAGFYLKRITNEQVNSAQSDYAAEEPNEHAETPLPRPENEHNATPHQYHAAQPPPEHAPISNPDTGVSNLARISPNKANALRDKLYELLRLKSQYAEIRNDIRNCLNRLPSILDSFPRHDKTQELYYRFRALDSQFYTVSKKSQLALEEFADRIREIYEAHDKELKDLARKILSD